MSAQLPPSTVAILKMPQRGGKENIGENYFHVCKEVLINHMFHMIVQVRVVLRKTVVGDLSLSLLSLLLLLLYLSLRHSATHLNDQLRRFPTHLPT